MSIRHRGFFFLDMLAGLLLLLALAAVLGVTITQQSRASLRLADSREAARLAEKALLDLRQNRPVPANNPDLAVEIIGPVQGSAALQWTRVRATVNGRSAAIVGATGRRP